MDILKVRYCDHLQHYKRSENDVTYHKDYARGNTWEAEAYRFQSKYILEDLLKEITDKTEKEKAELTAEFCRDLAKAFGGEQSDDE